MIKIDLKQKLSDLPPTPGVYLMRDALGHIIYVGKAKSLKSRVSSYFQNSELSAKTEALVAEICDFTVMLVNTEVEALLLERSLIKHHKPKYNVMLTDDKHYPWVRTDLNDPWPRLSIVRVRKKDKATYLGPFSSAGSLYSIMETMYKIFPLIRCSPYVFKTVKRPCNYYQMKQCLAPCVLKVSRQEYLDIIGEALDFLRGKSKAMKEKLSENMHLASAAENFEKAAHYRDILLALEKVKEKQSVIVAHTDFADVIGCVATEQLASVVVLQVRENLLLGEDHFIIKLPKLANSEILPAFLMQYYEHRPLPEEIILSENISEKQSLAKALAHGKETGYTPKINIHPSKQKTEIIALSLKNAQFHLDNHLKTTLKQLSILELLKTRFRLKDLPMRIECIDISNLGSTAIVGSCVAFIEGSPAKKAYRTYLIKNADLSQNDFAAISQIVERRIERGIKENTLPNLLVIDGGKAQLNAAITAAQSFHDMNVSIVSLAKKRVKKGDSLFQTELISSEERIFLPQQSDPILLDPSSGEYRLLTSMRNEAHRFALKFHQKKRSQIFFNSQLKEIPGIGPVLRKRLLMHFKDIELIKRASVEELQEVQGISPKVAESICAFFNTKS